MNTWDQEKFNKDLRVAKEIEHEVLKLLDYDEAMVTRGKFGFDILLSKDDRTVSIEVKHHTEPELYIPYEVFDYKTLLPLGIASTTADYWIDVISEKPEFVNKTVWITKVSVLRAKLRSLVEAGLTKNTKKESFGNVYAIISVPIYEVKIYAEGKGGFTYVKR